MLSAATASKKVACGGIDKQSLATVHTAVCVVQFVLTHEHPLISTYSAQIMETSSPSAARSHLADLHAPAIFEEEIIRRLIELLNDERSASKLKMSLPNLSGHWGTLL